jgi:hypothetical protein
VQPELDFALIDDVFPLSFGSSARAEITAAVPRQLGPLVEYAYAAATNVKAMPAVAELANTAQSRELQRVLAFGGFDRLQLDTSHEAKAVEFHWVPVTEQAANSPAWIMFLRRVQNAATRSGFTAKLGAGLAAAFEEMTDNALIHSLRPSTALAGYQWSTDVFEFVAADAGQGVLASLRMNAEFAGIRDHGEALRVALSEGASRFGPGSGHGFGFRQLFVSLANLNGRLRFRSGDHALLIDGTSPALASARLVQLAADYSGFLVSAVCSPSG